MTKSSKETLVPVSFWAVGRVAETSQVAIKLNDHPPLLLSVENAREIAAALDAEIAAVSNLPGVPASMPTSKRPVSPSKRLDRSAKKKPQAERKQPG